MSETTTRPISGLSAMKLDELKGVASSMGITGTTKMRKSDLVEAIKSRQAGGTGAPSATQPAGQGAQTAPPARASRRASRPAGASAATAPEVPTTNEAVERIEQPTRAERTEQAAPAREDRAARDEARAERAATEHAEPAEQAQGEQGAPREGRRQRQRVNDRQQGERATDRQDRQHDDRQQGERATDRQDRQQYDRQQGERATDRQDRQQNDRQQGDQQRADRQDERQDRQNDRQQQAGQQNRGPQQGRYDDEGGSRRSRNRQRSRDRKRGRTREGGSQDWNDLDLQVQEDDVLVPVAGILDVLDNYAFVRTSGYLPGPNDVYVPLGMVKKNGLRKGDAVTGAVKALREGEQPTGSVGRQKFNALVRLDTVNGMSAEDALKRVEFQKLTPLYPQQRLRLETEPNVLTTRIIDLVAPIGKGQRGLIVAPAKAGKTMIMQTLANAITANNPECHLMVVLVDERPEEVTDMQRAVKGEVISSTFDRPAEDHTTVAELAIERAKRLVELGHDVVVLLDSITKLGRAYNLAAPASGRILSGGVDSAALYPPKKFFGAARNIENGGSLTILATALVETGSKMDEVIFEEFKGTGNMELRLSRELANRRIFPAVDINASGTRREEILLAAEELKIMWKLRRVLAALDNQQGIELLIDRLKKTKTNYEFLMQVQQTSSIKLDED